MGMRAWAWSLLALAVIAQTPARDRLITANGIGPIQLGMTLAEARKAAPKAAFSRTSDGDGAALVQIALAPDVTVQAWADEEDPEKPIDWRKKILSLATFSGAFRTAEGAYPGIKVSDANRVYGATETIETSEIESRQFITFAKHPRGLLFRLDETGGALLSIAISQMDR
jgi:hypothetical protein